MIHVAHSNSYSLSLSLDASPLLRESHTAEPPLSLSLARSLYTARLTFAAYLFFGLA